MEKIYLAGFDVFYKDAATRFDRMRQLCKLAGFEALVPLDNEVHEGIDMAGDIYRANIEMLKRADGVIANLNAFRGTEPDSGTVFEVGYAVALGKKIIGYTDIKDWKSHVAEKSGNKMVRIFEATIHRPDPNFNIEDFGLPLNLMLSKSIHVINGDFVDALDAYRELVKNIECNASTNP